MSFQGSANGAGKHDGIQAQYGEEVPPLHRRLELAVLEVVPDLDSLVDMSQVMRWTGTRPVTPDCQPIVGLTCKHGLLVNCGHSFNGWRQASLCGELLAKVAIAGDNAALGPEYEALYSIERFRLTERFVFF
jgi:glycine/D-amino acid oxidase-like deaminating enzyme